MKEHCYPFEKLISQAPSVSQMKFSDLLSTETISYISDMSKFHLRPQVQTIVEMIDKEYSNCISPVLAASESVSAICRSSLKSLERSITVAPDVLSSVSVEALSSCRDICNLSASAIIRISSISQGLLNKKPNVNVSKESSDVVTFDQAPAQQLNIPETIAIPFGHHKVCMKTEIFISIVGGILLPLIVCGYLVLLLINAQVLPSSALTISA